MPTVLLSAPYLIPVRDRFLGVLNAAGVEVVVPQVEERLEEEALLPYAGRIDGVMCGDDQFTARVLKRFAPRLKVISKWGTGIDSIDREAAAALDIRVFNTPAAFTEAVADTVLGYMLDFARQLPWLDRKLKAGAWEKLPGHALHECTLGVVGVGHIGKAVVRRAAAFGVALLGNDPVEIEAAFLREWGLSMLDLPELLRRSDFVSLNCDLNPTSFHLIDAEALGHMRAEAVLINTARGAVVDEAALVAVLRQGRIRGAGLDVFETEPLPLDSPLRSMDNVLLAPHNANASPRAWEKVHRNTIRNLLVGLSLPVPAELETV